MPQRWERALSDIPRLEAPDRLWRDSVERADRGGMPDPRPPRRQRLVVAFVAAGVFLAAAGFSWQVFENNGTRPPASDATSTTPVPAPARPSASIMLLDPGTNADVPVPTATLEFGDYSSVVKTTDTSYVHPFATTMELPVISMGLPAGLPIGLDGDARSLTLELYGYPRSDDAEPVASYDLSNETGRLPDQLGSYWLTVRGEWSDGWATYASVISVIRPGTLQFVLEDNGRAGDATGELWMDGLLVNGTVVRQIKWQSDVGSEEQQTPVGFASDAYLPVDAGAPVVVRGDPNELSGSITGPDWVDASREGTRFPMYGPGARIPAEPGHHLLVIDVAWQDGQLGWAGNGYREEILFAFPVDIGTNDVAPSGQVPPGPIEVRFDTSEVGKIPRAYAVFGDRKYPAVMTSYRYVIDGEVFESSKQYVDAPMVAAATIVARPDTRIDLGTGADRVLVGWGDAAPTTARSTVVQGLPGDTAVLHVRGRWGAESWVEWELFIDISSW